MTEPGWLFEPPPGVAAEHYRVGDCREVLASMEPNSIDACVTDPPYELGFMGKRWDSSGVAFDPETWRAVLRVLKPGGHLLAFSGTRTYHRMVCAIEDAGFEIRDQLAWMYGSGFPKSLDVSKAIDSTILTGGSSPKMQADAREALGRNEAGSDERHGFTPDNGSRTGVYRNKPGSGADWQAVSPEAQQWSGWGTALKPAQEPIVLARKPLIGTVAANVLAHGTGGLNVDGCRIGSDAGYDAREAITRRTPMAVTTYAASEHGDEKAARAAPHDAGRWPANVLLDESAAAMLDAQSGVSKSSDRVRNNGAFKSVAKGAETARESHGFADSGGASRFFYVAKASRSEREAGLDHLPKHTAGGLTDRTDGSDGLKSPRAGAGRTSTGRANNHPTVKPIALMRYLVRLITPPGGIVLDPFAGSGTTLCAAALEGFGCLGIDLTDQYVALAGGRLRHIARYHGIDIAKDGAP